MKISDIIGFAAILAAGYYIGKNQANVSWSRGSVALIAVLLVVGWYFAVTLS